MLFLDLIVGFFYVDISQRQLVIMSKCEEYALFSDKKWTGEFFLPDDYDHRFSGEIFYSPEHGVVLNYTITGFEVPNESDILHGVLSTGEQCTLIGKFSPAYAGMSFRSGLTTRQGEDRFQFLAIGDFLALDESFAEIDFSLTNLQEFFYASGLKDRVKYSENPICSVATPFGEMQIGNSARFGHLHNEISSQVYSSDAQALASLEMAFKEVQAKHPDAFFMLKKDIAYRIVLKLLPSLTLRDAYSHIYSFAKLFALLICNPVYPESIRVKKIDAEGQSFSLEVYPSMVLDPRTIKQSAKAQFHPQMPIRKNTIKFESIVTEWFKAQHSQSPVVTRIQSETGFRSEHVAHGEIVLYATQIESISYSAGEKDKKYEYPLQVYGCQRLQAGIMKAFGVHSLEDMAIALADLRNEIAHVGRPKKWLTSLSLGQLVDVSRYLQLTIIGYILQDIGVPKDVVENYQAQYAPAW